MSLRRRRPIAPFLELLSLAQQLAKPPTTPPPVVTPTTPSAMIPPYLKPKADGRRKRPGRKHGHPGSRRPAPEPKWAFTDVADGDRAPHHNSDSRWIGRTGFV